MACLPSHHTPGPGSHLMRLRRRRLGGFQCSSLFASASKTDFHAMLVCEWVYSSLLFLFSPPPSLRLKACGAEERERERWHVVKVTVP